MIYWWCSFFSIITNNSAQGICPECTIRIMLLWSVVFCFLLLKTDTNVTFQYIIKYTLFLLFYEFHTGQAQTDGQQLKRKVIDDGHMRSTLNLQKKARLVEKSSEIKSER